MYTHGNIILMSAGFTAYIVNHDGTVASHQVGGSNQTLGWVVLLLPHLPLPPSSSPSSLFSSSQVLIILPFFLSLPQSVSRLC